MRHISTYQLILCLLILFSTTTNALETHQADQQFNPEMIRSYALKIFGSAYFVLHNSSQLVSQTSHQARDEIDRFFYDVRKQGIAETHQRPASNIENCFVTGWCGQNN